MRVAITGSWKKEHQADAAYPLEDGDRYAEACSELGEALIHRGHTLVVGSASERTADYHVTLGAVRTLRDDRPQNPIIEVLRSAGDTKRPYSDLRRRFPGVFSARQIATGVNWHITHLFEARRADSMIVIGGGEGSFQAGVAAALMGRLVIPIGSFGGAGRKLVNLFATSGPDWEQATPKPDLLAMLNEPWSDHLLKVAMLALDERTKIGAVGPAKDRKRVFVVHGRNISARDAMFTFLRALGLHPIEWNEGVLQVGGTPQIADVLDRVFDEAQAVIVLLTGDDEARLRAQFRVKGDHHWERTLIPQARQNVVFEAGMAFGSHAERTILVQLPPVRPFSDILGRFIIPFDGTAESLALLRNLLISAGCDVTQDATDSQAAEAIRAALHLQRGPSAASTSGPWQHQITLDRRIITTTIARWPSDPKWFWVFLKVTSANPFEDPLTGSVTFQLHEDYPEPLCDVPVIDGEAVLVVYTEAPYEVVVHCDGAIRVDLRSIAGVPWRKR